MRGMSSPSRLRWLAPLLILLVAAFLRLSRLDLMEYKYDQIIAVMMARDIVDGTRFHLTSLASSVGLHNPGLFVWMLALSALVNDSPLAMVGFIAALNVAALGMFYLLFRRRWPEPVVLIAMLLMSVSPWAVFYSRCIWAQDLLPLFMVPFAYFLLQFLDHRRTRDGALALVLLGLAAQVHMSAVFFLPGVALLLFHRKLLFHRAVAIAATILLLSLVPFFVHLWRDWQQTQDFLELGRRSVHPADIAGLLRYGAIIGGGLGFLDFNLADHAAKLAADFPFSVRAMQMASVLLMALTGVGAVLPLTKNLPDPIGRDLRRGLLLIAGLWLGYWIGRVPSYPHYAIILYPWPFVLAAAGLWWIASALRSTPSQRIVAWGTTLLMSGGFGAFDLAFARYIDTRNIINTPYNTPYGTLPVALVAQTLDIEGFPGRAAMEMQRAVRRNPRDANLRAELAWYTARDGRPREGLAMLEEMFAADSRNKPVVRRLILTLSQFPEVRDARRAIVLAKQAATTRPIDPEDVFNLSIAYNAGGQRAAAVDTLRSLLLNPNFPETHPYRRRYEQQLREWTTP